MNNKLFNNCTSSKTSRYVIVSFVAFLCTACLCLAILGLSFNISANASSAMNTETYYCVLKVDGKDVVLTCTDTQAEGYSTNGYIWNGLWSKLVDTGSYYETNNRGYHQYKIIENYSVFKSFFSEISSFADVGYEHLYTNMMYEGEYATSFFYAKSKTEALKNDRYVYQLKVVTVYISSVNQLNWFASNYNSKFVNKAYLKKDLNLLGTNWVPIGSDANSAFKGTFDGSGFCIYNFAIKDYKYSGFFGYTIDATISNLEIKQVNISGSSSNKDSAVGAIVAKAENTTISNCQIDSSVKISNHFNIVGGVAGDIIGLITDCYSMADIAITMNGPEVCHSLQYYITAGGVAGRAGNYEDSNSTTAINNCIFNGTIKAEGTVAAVIVAGIVANTENTIISHCVVAKPNFDVTNCKIAKEGEIDPISAPSQRWEPLTKIVTKDIFGGFFYNFLTKESANNGIMSVHIYKIAEAGGNVVVEDWYTPSVLFGQKQKTTTVSITITNTNNYVYDQGDFVKN